MNDDDIRSAVLRSIHHVAPEADASKLGDGDDLREALDMDSMDFLKFVVELHDALHVDVPERDYPRIRTLEGCVRYLASKVHEQ